MRRSQSLLLVLVVGWLSVAGCTPTNRSVSSAVSSEETIEQVKEKGPVKLVLRLSPPTPRLSDLVDFEIEVTSAIDVEIEPPAFGESVGNFLVRDYVEKSEASSDKKPAEKSNSVTRRFRYRLEPVHAGLHLIRSIAVVFVDNRPESENRGQESFIESDPLEVKITSELGDKVPSLADLAPMLPPRPLERASSWKWLWLVVPIALAIGWVVWTRKHRTKQESGPPPLSPTEIAHRALAELLAENLPSQGRVQEFYIRLTGIVRVYIEGTTGVRAPEQTTEEFLRTMHSRDLFSLAQSVRLQEFLEAADMVKYAGQQPNPEQIELSIARAREFVQMQSTTSILIPESSRD